MLIDKNCNDTIDSGSRLVRTSDRPQLDNDEQLLFLREEVERRASPGVAGGRGDLSHFL
jgi:hypothetical protein